MDSTLNFNECFKSISNFGGTLYQNICSGEVNFVPWGTMDWIGSIGVIAILGLGIYGVVWAIKDMNKGGYLSKLNNK